MVHELGHFFAAKAFKIRVDKFGFGLPVGPTLFKKQIGETEFLVHALLLGGYVSFPDDDANSELAADSPERFANKPIWQRLIVIVAGVFANFLTAIFLVMFAAGVWHKLPSNTFETTFEELTPTAVQSVREAKFQKGDVFYEINGTKVTLPNILTQYLYLSREKDGFVSQERVDKKIAEIKKLNPNISPDKVIDKGVTVKLPAFDDEEMIHAENEFSATCVTTDNEILPYQMVSGFGKGTTFRNAATITVDANEYLSLGFSYVIRFGNAESGVFQKMSMEARAYF